jgi:U5 small nuclear ribonucleoprotein component
MNTYYRGEAGEFKEKTSKGQSDGPLLINAVKMYHNMDYKSFGTFGKIISGTIRKGDNLRILGENYVHADQ